MLNVVVNLFSKKTDIKFYSNFNNPILDSYNFEFSEKLLDKWIIFVYEKINNVKNNLKLDINQIVFSIKNILHLEKNTLMKVKSIFNDLFNAQIKLIDYFELVSTSTNINEGYIIYFGFELIFVKINDFKNVKYIKTNKMKLDYLNYEYFSKKLINYFLKYGQKNDSNLFLKFKNDFQINSNDKINIENFLIMEWLTNQSQIIQEKFIINEIKKVLIKIVKHVEKKDTNIYVICDFKNNELILKLLKRYFLNKEKCIFLV